MGRCGVDALLMEMENVDAILTQNSDKVSTLVPCLLSSCNEDKLFAVEI